MWTLRIFIQECFGRNSCGFFEDIFGAEIVEHCRKTHHGIFGIFLEEDIFLEEGIPFFGGPIVSPGFLLSENFRGFLGTNSGVAKIFWKSNRDLFTDFLGRKIVGFFHLWTL